MSSSERSPTLLWDGKSDTPPQALGDFVTENDEKTRFDSARSALIQGDNLPVLQALLPALEGQIRCVYLDPPYNTGTTFEHYRDAQAHNDWLTMMRDRLVAIRPLLHPEAVVFVQIDDRESAYLQLVMDEVFGRARRINTICVKMSELSGVKMTHAGDRLPKLKEYLHVYGASPSAVLQPFTQLKDEETLRRYLRYYTQIIEDPSLPVESWVIRPIRDVMREAGLEITADSLRAYQLQHRDRVVYRTNNALLSKLQFPSATARVVSPTGIEYVWWEGRQMLFLKDHVETTLGDLWTDISTINLHREGGVSFRSSKKPEALLERIIHLGSHPGDWVLDAFAGSGTTAAVAERMGRRWIAIEEGAHAQTHIVPRLSTLSASEGRPFDYQFLVWKKHARSR